MVPQEGNFADERELIVDKYHIYSNENPDEEKKHIISVLRKSETNEP